MTWVPWIAAIFLCLSSTQAQNRSDEASALLAFKHTTEVVRQTGTDGLVYEPRGYWTSWVETDSNPCSWVGITCSPNFTVQAIDLSGWGINRLIGFESLASLQGLQQLDLSQNQLQGTKVPDEIGNLTRVSRLDLSRNGFVGRIPDVISDCKTLRYLSFEENNLEGEIPSLSGLTKLQVLSLAHNSFTGPVLQQFRELTSLVSLDLSNNMLNGSVPSLPKLTNLLDLNLDNNNFTNFEDPQRPLSASLRHVFISGNQLEGPIPPGLVSLLHLAVLNMSSNQFSGNIPSGLARQSNHSFWLDLSQNQLEGEIPADLLQPVSIDYTIVSLNLSHNLLTGKIPLNLGVGQKVWYDVLDLSHNQLQGPLPNLSGQNGEAGLNLLIFHLCLQNNHLSGDIIDLLLLSNEFSFTTELRLDDNLFTGDLTRMLDSWGEFGFLSRVLDLSNNNLQMLPTKEHPDPVRSTLESLVNSTLKEFRIGGNNFSGTSLPSAYVSGYNTHLEVLDLSNSHLQGQISSAVFNRAWLPALRYLNFSNNEATGSIPGDMFLLENLTVLDVSNNNLSGVLPTITLNSSLYNPNFFAGNRLCGAPLQACPSPELSPTVQGTGVKWWILLIVIVSSLVVSVGSCAFAVWRWRVYSRKHQQDADLIKTLLEKDSASLMSLRDLRKATSNFAESRKIGAGGFGIVYSGTLNNGTSVAIKRSKREGTEGDKQQFLNEVRVLTHVHHRHLVKLLGCCMENKVALLVLEFVPNGTLHGHLKGKYGPVRLSWKQRVLIAVQTADALNYLHFSTTFPIVHRDVKSANILLTNDLNAKVADFGISKLLPEEATHASTAAFGTFGYLDPDYYTTGQLTAKSDVYSFGVVLLELISAKPVIDPSRGEDNIHLVKFAARLINRGALEPLLDPNLMEIYLEPAGRESILRVGRLALRCLDIRPRDRPRMSEVWKELQTLSLDLDDTSNFIVESDDNSSSKRMLVLGPAMDSSTFDESTSEGANSNIQLMEFRSKHAER